MEPLLLSRLLGAEATRGEKAPAYGLDVCFAPLPQAMNKQRRHKGDYDEDEAGFLFLGHGPAWTDTLIMSPCDRQTLANVWSCHASGG